MSGAITLVHVTHEAAEKIGGIGSVLEGFFTSPSYIKNINRSIIIGPLFKFDCPLSHRLGSDSQVLYSSLDGIAKTPYASAFQHIEHCYHTRIIYGFRKFIDSHTGQQSSQEVLLIDVSHIHSGVVNTFKKHLFENFGIESHEHEKIWEYEQYVRLAPVAIAALKAMDAAKDSTIVVAHEFMGIPTALAAMLEHNCQMKTIFYAHEVATIRRIVEEHPGHDVTFYNAMNNAQHRGLYLGDVFGDQSDYFKHPLVESARFCDTVCAVGNYVADELRFLCPEFQTADIDIVYNGIPSSEISMTQKMKSKEKLQNYCDNLLGYKPDFVFTHVARLVKSKGLWRDLQILKHLEQKFRTSNQTAVMLLLSTETCQRPGHDIHYMESRYNWPVAHRENWPDLSGGEANFYASIQEFNARSRNIKVIFINQFGFNPRYCGRKMPEDMEFTDIRIGSDVEFGMSIYEPFGIAQLESLPFGATCVISNVCGCAGFLRDVADVEHSKNVIIADYINVNHSADLNPMDLDEHTYHKLGDLAGKAIASQIYSYLPSDETQIQQRLQIGYGLARKMTWEAVVNNYLLPAVKKVLNKAHSSVGCHK